MERVFVFIDASNLWQAQKSKGRLLDYEKLTAWLKEQHKTEQLRCFYYSAYPADGTRVYSIDGKHRFFTYLKKGLGMTVRKKELKRIAIMTPEGEAIEEKGNMDIEIAVDAMHHLRNYDTALFFTGDSDFLALVTYLRVGGKRVFIYSSKNNISQELKTGADGYHDILKISDDIWRDELRHRPESL